MTTTLALARHRGWVAYIVWKGEPFLKMTVVCKFQIKALRMTQNAWLLQRVLPFVSICVCVVCVCVGGGCILEDDKKMTTTHGTSKASQLSSMHRMEEGNVLEDSGLLVPNHQGFENDPNFLVHGYCNVSFHPTRSLRERRGSWNPLRCIFLSIEHFHGPSLSCLWHGAEFDPKKNWNMYCFRCATPVFVQVRVACANTM